MTIQTHERRNRWTEAGIAALFLVSALGFSTRPIYAAADKEIRNNEVAVRIERLKKVEPPKVTFLVKLQGDFANFYIAYQPANAKPGDSPMTTPYTIVDPKDTRKQFGSPHGGTLDTLALAPGTEYEYWLVGTYRDIANKLYISPKGTFSNEIPKGLKDGILTEPAMQPDKDVTTVTFEGAIGKPKEDGNAYIEYGNNPHRLERKTREKSFDKGAHFYYSIDESLLQPGLTYYYRFAADYADGTTAAGGTLNFKVADVSLNRDNPCSGRGSHAPLQKATRISENVAVVCSGNGLAGSIFKGSGAQGQLVCPESFPRNLNTSTFTFTVPKVNVPVSIEQKGVGYWRSSVDVRFNDWMLWVDKGQEGQQDPLRQGSQKYDVTNWSPQPQTLVVWIYCSNNWAAPNTFK